MTFVNDSGGVITIQSAVALTKQAISFFNFQISGDYSVNFTVPNNADTRSVLGYYGPQMNIQVAFSKQAFTAIDNDGNILTRGSIVIQDDTVTELNCFFVSGNSNWFNLLKGIITELNWDGYAEQFIDSSAGKTNTTGLIYPLADWGYNLKKGSNYYHLMWRQLHIVDSNGVWPITSPPTQLTNRYFFDQYPCVYLATVVQEVLQQNGLKLSGNITQDQIYNSMIITPDSGVMTRNPVPEVSLIGSAKSITTALGVDQKYDAFNTELSDPENAVTNSKYTAPRKCAVRLNITRTASAGSPPANIVGIYKNGAIYGTANNGPWTYGAADVYGGNFSVVYSELIPLNQGDTIELYLTGTGTPYTFTMNLKIIVDTVIMPGDIVSPKNFLPKKQGIDLIKFIVQYFGCSVYFNENSKDVIVNIIEKISKENALDWSDYYVSHRSEYTVEQAQNNYIRFTPTDELNVGAYNDRTSIGFGEGNIPTANTLKFQNDLFTVPFCASFFGQSLNSIFNPICPLFELTDNGAGYAFTATANGINTPGGSENFTMTVSSPMPYSTGGGPCEVWRIVTNEIGEIGYYVTFGLDAGPKAYFYGIIGASYSGIMYRQNITYKNNASRILIANPNRNIRDISLPGSVSSIKVTTGNEVSNNSTLYDHVAFSWFSKPKTGQAFDAQRTTLGVDNPNITGWTTQHTIKEMYFNKISGILNNPTVRAQMILPKAVFQSFDFSNFIYIKTKDLTGYFFVDSIVNYEDSKTSVEVNLFML